jgi:hypothetical protein
VDSFDDLFLASAHFSQSFLLLGKKFRNYFVMIHYVMLCHKRNLSKRVVKLGYSSFYHHKTPFMNQREKITKIK